MLFLFESFNALVALEWSFPSVRSHVLLQMTGYGAGIVALITFEWLFSCMLPHRVNFQITSCNASIPAKCASVWLCTRVRLLMRLLFYIDIAMSI